MSTLYKFLRDRCRDRYRYRIFGERKLGSVTVAGTVLVTHGNLHKVEFVRKILTLLSSCLLLTAAFSVEAGAELQIHEVNEEFGLCRLFVQMVTNNDRTVLEKYDSVVLQLQRAYLTEGTVQKEELLKVLRGIRWVAEHERFHQLPHLLSMTDSLLHVKKVRDSEHILATLLQKEDAYPELRQEFGERVESLVRASKDHNGGEER